MECVDPIKSIDEINTIKRILKQHSQRDLLFFILGINTGLRVSDLLFLKVDDVWNGNEVKDFLYLEDTHSKEKKVKAYYLNHSVRAELKSYLLSHDFQKDDYLFKSKKKNHPITRQQAYRIIHEAAIEAGVGGKIGTHTLRKTFGYHAYRKGIAISILMKIFNHHSASETLHYIGVDDSEEKLIKVDVNL